MAKKNHTLYDTKKRSLPLNDHAFSLVELMATLLLISIVALAVGNLFMNTQRFYLHSKSRMSARDDASHVLRVLETELRQIFQASDDFQSMEIADKNQLVFYADIDNDDKPEKINYLLDGRSVIKKVTQTSNDSIPWEFNGAQTQTTLTSDSNNSTDAPLFKYYSAIDQELTGTPLGESDRQLVKIIKAAVSVELENSIKEDKFETEIFLRNTNNPL